MNTNGRHHNHFAGRLSACALSDAGKRHTSNEDAFAALPDQGVLIVSDGIQTGAEGATAARIVCEVLPAAIQHQLSKIPTGEISVLSETLKNSILSVSQNLYRKTRSVQGLAGMGATVTLVYIRGNQAYIANLGDSRAYLFRNRVLYRLTHDHTVVNVLLQEGTITPDEAKSHPARHMLSRFVGMETPVAPDLHTVQLWPGDRLLLCTDGLTNEIAEEDLEEILSQFTDIGECCRALVDRANTLGGRDNITVVLGEWIN